MIQKIIITAEELEDISFILSKFEGATYVELTRDSGSGIGYTLTASIPTVVNEQNGTFVTEITNVSNW